MKRRAPGSSHPTRPAPAWEGASIVDVADALLLAFVRQDGASLRLGPGPSDDDYRAVVDDEVERALAMPKAVGSGVVARLAILTGLDVGAPQDRIGRIRLRVPSPDGPFDVDLIGVGQSGERGLALEMRRLASASHYAIVHDDEIAEMEGVPVAAPRTDAVYEIHRELGRGGMATVYLGTHRALEKSVAIKILNAASAANPALAASLIREGRAASRIRHPGVVGVTDFGTLSDGRAYLVMEYIESDTVSAALEAGPLPALRALRIAREVADALEAVRAADVVHGDIKPSNIFRSPAGLVEA